MMIRENGLLFWPPCYLRVRFYIRHFMEWFGLDVSGEHPEWIGSDWIHKLMNWIALDWVSKNGPMSFDSDTGIARKK